MSVSIINAFTPSQEVRDPERFAGRIDVLRSLGMALATNGTHIVIHGNRGVGKSSVARQLESMSAGDIKIIEKINHDGLIQRFDFLPIYFSCDGTVVDIDTLLVKLLTEDSALAPWMPFKVVSRQQGGEGGGKLSIKILELNAKATGSITERQQEVDADIYTTFKNVAKSIANSNVSRNGLLIIVDEFDTIKNQAKLSAFLKSLDANLKVKFALVGVAKNIQGLINEHESLARQLTGGCILVDAMNEQEMLEIFERAENILGNKYKFSDKARQWIIKVAKGHPYYVHLLGQQALIAGASAGATVIDEQMAQDAMNEIALKGSAPIQENLYKTAIGHSYMREFILKSFANEIDEEIHTTDLYNRISRDLNTEGAVVSVYVGHLASDRGGSVLEKTRERYYRFRDSLFKAYAAARPFQLRPGTKEEGGEA